MQTEQSSSGHRVGEGSAGRSEMQPLPSSPCPLPVCPGSRDLLRKILCSFLCPRGTRDWFPPLPSKFPGARQARLLGVSSSTEISAKYSPE